MKTNETKYAYLAGLIDGEGHVKIDKRRFSISVEMKSQPTIEWLQKNFKGSHLVAVRLRGAETYTIHRWTVSGRTDIQKVIEGVLPYSITKRDQLLILQEALNIKGRKHLHIYEQALKNTRQREKDVND